jgi:phage major head subunit gpT-like protein
MPSTLVKYQALDREITRRISLEFANQTPFYPSLCNVVPSNKASEKYAWLGESPVMREWIGDRIFHEMRAADYALANKHFEVSITAERTDIEDDETGAYPDYAQKMARRAVRHPDKLLGEVVRNAESLICWDGQYFFDTDHEFGDSGTQSNKLNSTVVAAATPTPAEFRTAFHAALLKMLTYKDDQGVFFMEPVVEFGMNDLVVTVPPALAEVALKAFEQTVVVEGGAGVSNYVLARPRVVPYQHMSAAAGGSDVKFDLYYTGDVFKPYVFQNRQPLRFDRKGYNPGDREFKQAKWMLDARYNVGVLAWFYAVRTTFVTA